jgi:hypothetical protein
MTPPQTTELEARGFKIESMRHAFELGKQMRREEIARCVRRGWPSQKSSSQEVSKPVNNLHLNGGGLDGLIDDAVKLALNESAGNVGKAAEKLKINRSTVYEYRKRLNLAVVILLASTLWCFAQRGTLTPKVATSAPAVSIFSMPSAAVAPFKQTVLTWDNPPGASNRVAWGLSRNAWTNGNRTITTNTFFVTNGWHYKVTAMVAGVESIPALWPSNRFDRIWIQTSTNLATWKRAFIWQTNFNLPQEFLRTEAELIRWE